MKGDTESFHRFKRRTYATQRKIEEKAGELTKIALVVLKEH